MKFRTEIEIGHGEVTLRPEKPVVMVGSCFADNISGRMRRCLWDACNPLGVLFNPLSIAAALELTLFNPEPEASFRDSLFEHQGITHSWLFDTHTSTLDGAEGATAIFNRRRDRLRTMLEKGETLFVTFGTAFCYFLNEDSESYQNYGAYKTYEPYNTDKAPMPPVVANCHKQPAAMFTRRRVTCGEITDVWLKLAEKLKARFPNLKIIFTVSPVRHVRDGLAENSRSKATLLLAVDELCSKMDFCHYFPAYEIVNDDLRDYRFYASDLVHPSDEGVEYIWERLREAYLDEAGLKFLKEGEAIARRAAHRPIMEIPEQRAAFRNKTMELYEDFRRHYPDSLELQ